MALAAATSSAGAASTAATTAVSDAADTMLRTNHPNTDVSSIAERAEVCRLLSRQAALQTDHKTYLTSEVAAQTGISAPVAQQRVDTALTSLRDAADKSRKASSALGFFTALSMLIGAFIACCAAGFAGHQRDERADITSAV